MENMHYSNIEGLPESITCPDCEKKSWNANDIAQGWCGGCHKWTSDPQSDAVRRRVAEKFQPARQRGPADSSPAQPWESAKYHPDYVRENPTFFRSQLASSEEIERLRAIEKLLLLFSHPDINDELMWRGGIWEGFPGPGRWVETGLRFAVDCSDTFAWGTSDAEDVDLSADLEALAQAKSDAEDHFYWPTLWVSRKRCLRPMRLFYEKRLAGAGEKKMRSLFDAAGPERDPATEG